MLPNAPLCFPELLRPVDAEVSQVSLLVLGDTRTLQVGFIRELQSCTEGCMGDHMVLWIDSPQPWVAPVFQPGALSPFLTQSLQSCVRHWHQMAGCFLSSRSSESLPWLSLDRGSKPNTHLIVALLQVHCFVLPVQKHVAPF